MREAFRSAQEFTEGKLPEEKIFDLLSSVGNGENKALELIVMKKGVIYSRSDLYKEVMNHQAENERWKMDKMLPFSHCQASLAPIGLVAREALSLDSTVWGYEVTSYGLATGMPFAGVILKWSHEHPKHSLYKMFGATMSPSVKHEQSLDKKRSPEARYKIFWEITINPNKVIRLQDIANAISEDPVFTRQHLVSLRRDGVISYETIEHGKPFSYFRLKEASPDQNPKHYATYKTLSTKIYDLLNQAFRQENNDYLSVEQIANYLVQKYPEYNDLERKSLSGRIVAISSHLEKQGYVERRMFGFGFQSELNLLDEQREAIVSLITHIEKFKNGDRQTIEQGRSFAQRVVNDPNLYSELMLKAKGASPFANKTNRQDVQSYLASILQDHPNSTATQIQQFLKEDYDKRLTTNAIRKLLSTLLEDKKITFEKTKSGHVYRV